MDLKRISYGSPSELSRVDANNIRLRYVDDPSQFHQGFKFVLINKAADLDFNLGMGFDLD